MHAKYGFNTLRPQQKGALPIKSSLPKCNCKGGPVNCPFNGNCLQNDVVYEAEVITIQEARPYIGATQDFKGRYTTHMSNTKLEKYENATSLATYIWSLKRKNIEYRINWKILCKARSYCPESGKCNLCITEKSKILFYKGRNLINKRSEIMAKCRHRAKHKLESVK